MTEFEKSPTLGQSPSKAVASFGRRGVVGPSPRFLKRQERRTSGVTKPRIPQGNMDKASKKRPCTELNVKKEEEFSNESFEENPGEEDPVLNRRFCVHSISPLALSAAFLENQFQNGKRPHEEFERINHPDHRRKTVQPSFRQGRKPAAP